MKSTQFDRRNFLSLAGKSLGLAALSSSTIASLLKEIHAATKTIAHLTPEQAAIDEDYWSTIQNAFTVTRGIINLNNGGVSPSPRIVTEALVRYIWQQEDATAYTMWQILEPQSETIRTGLAELFGCDREEIAITRNASESLETLLLGLDLKSGDEVLTTTQDYGRMLTTIRQREQREGIKLNLIKIPIPPKNINEITSAFERAITPRTRLIQIAHQVNITGQITPVKAVCQMARARGVEEIGTHSAAPKLAIGEAMLFHNGIGGKRKEARLRYLSRYWMNKLKDIPKVRFNTSFDPAQMCAIANVQVEGMDQGKIGSYLFGKHHIFTTPIVHEEFQGLRITPNLYTTLPELDRFCGLMAEIARKGLPAA